MMELPNLSVALGATVNAQGWPWWESAVAARLVDAVHGREPAQGTEIRVAATASDLCVRFELADLYVWATHTERDGPLYNEEVVEVFLDPIGDLAGYFELELNPMGAVLDLVIRRNRAGLRKDFRWQCEGLRTRSTKTEQGWVGEFAIPWLSVAQEPPRPGARWRANFCRIDRPEGRPRELSAWSPTGYEQFHVPERFGILEFA